MPENQNHLVAPMIISFTGIAILWSHWSSGLLLVVGTITFISGAIWFVKRVRR